MTPAQRQQLADLRRRGFGIPAARELANELERIDRRRAQREAEKQALPQRDELFPANLVPDRDRVTAGDIGACVLIAGIILIGLPICAIVFALGGAS